MPTETWTPRPPGAAETIWDGGTTQWDVGLAEVLAQTPQRTTWDGNGLGEVWTPRPPGTLP